MFGPYIHDISSYMLLICIIIFPVPLPVQYRLAHLRHHLNMTMTARGLCLLSVQL